MKCEVKGCNQPGVDIWDIRAWRQRWLCLWCGIDLAKGRH